MKTVKHKNIVDYYGHEQIDNVMYIYLEYMSAGIN